LIDASTCFYHVIFGDFLLSFFMLPHDPEPIRPLYSNKGRMGYSMLRQQQHHLDVSIKLMMLMMLTMMMAMMVMMMMMMMTMMTINDDDL